MKTFEEKWTAWLDGQLIGRELLEFEASLPDRAAAEAEKAEARKVGELLKRELGPRTLTNEEFFSHQLRERIEQEAGEGSRASAVRRPPEKNLRVVDNSSPVVDRHRVARCLFSLYGSRHARKKSD